MAMFGNIDGDRQDRSGRIMVVMVGLLVSVAVKTTGEACELAMISWFMLSKSCVCSQILSAVYE